MNMWARTWSFEQAWTGRIRSREVFIAWNARSTWRAACTPPRPRPRPWRRRPGWCGSRGCHRAAPRRRSGPRGGTSRSSRFRRLSSRSLRFRQTISRSPGKSGSVTSATASSTRVSGTSGAGATSAHCQAQRLLFKLPAPVSAAGGALEAVALAHVRQMAGAGVVVRETFLEPLARSRAVVFSSARHAGSVMATDWPVSSGHRILAHLHQRDKPFRNNQAPRQS